jgi:hypothetical protein
MGYSEPILCLYYTPFFASLHNQLVKRWPGAGQESEKRMAKKGVSMIADFFAVRVAREGVMDTWGM